jgi:catecholate siderophore receptor
MAGRNAPLAPLGALIFGFAIAPRAALAQDPGDRPGGETPLAPVEVKDTRPDEESGYQPGLTTVGRLKQLPRDIPQSVTVVPSKLIEDRGADTLREALRNVAGITFNAGEGGRIGDNVSIRGFAAVGDLYLDGLRDMAQYNREVFNLETVEVLKGSASMLFGRGATGGVVNQVSKQPLMDPQYDAAVVAGSFDYRRATVDLNHVVGDNAAIRVNAMATKSDSFRDAVHLERSGFAPSFVWGFGTPDEFHLAYYHLAYKDLPDYGVPYFKGRPLDVPTTRFYGLANADQQRDSASIATGTWIHRLGGDELKAILRAASYERDLRAVAPRLPAGTTVVTDATTLNRQRQARGGEEDMVTGQVEWTGKRAFAGMKHLLLAGAEYSGEKARRWNYANGVANPPTTVGNPDPFVALPDAYFTSIVRTNPNAFEAKSVGLYAQDFAQIRGPWKALLGARIDRFDGDFDRPLPQGDLSRTDRVGSWRSGLLYQPDDSSSYYASAGSSYNPSGELYQLDDRTANTPPEKSRNYEMGAKWEARDGNLSLRAALFRTIKTSERNTDLSNPTVSVLSGRRHTDGAEVEAAGRIAPGWEVFASAALMDGRVDEASFQQAGTEGKRPINTPRYTFSVWSTYRIAPNWRAGGGCDGVGDRFGDANNVNTVPGYARCDAMLAFEQKRYVVKVNVLNIFDRAIYEGVYAGHVVPGPGRNLQVTLELRY